MRLPFDLLDIGGNTNMDSADVGDLSIIFKAILFEDREMNYLFSGGLVVTVPTGPTALGGPGFTLDTFNSTLLQPFIGFLWTPGNFYLHGFSSIDVPTDPNDVTFLFNDLGIGYFVFRNRDGEPDGRKASELYHRRCAHKSRFTSMIRSITAIPRRTACWAFRIGSILPAASLSSSTAGRRWPSASPHRSPDRSPMPWKPSPTSNIRF